MNKDLRTLTAQTVSERASSMPYAFEALASRAQETHGIGRLLDSSPRDKTVEDILAIYQAATSTPRTLR